MSEKYNEFAGVYSLLLTPFKEDRSIDFKVFEQYVEWQASFRPQHLFAVCGSSEMVDLTFDERIRIAKTAVAHSQGVPVFASANIEPSWFAQVEEVKTMSQTGVSGLVFTTKGFGNDQERMFTYLNELSSFTDLPIVLYEYPGFSPKTMSGETYGKLVATGKFKGIKDTTCTLAEIKDKIAYQGDSNVLQANIPLLYEAYIAGAKGVCATPTSCGADLFVKMWDEFLSGDLEKAKQTFYQIILLDNAIDSGFNASAKYLVSLRGIPMNWYTRGSHKLSEARMHSLKVYYDWAKENGVLD